MYGDDVILVPGNGFGHKIMTAVCFTRSPIVTVSSEGTKKETLAKTSSMAIYLTWEEVGALMVDR